ncbi:hypothetical protein GCM10027285_21230 [Oleiagrimonas citrea]|uniref:TonB C-terminal domain-containing protein n=1 Tax=Oleiagrimonas citrea TaxID=1665687 RepID=A0A846ZJ00_9GAMM|nr:hypothetical protein [Oleiagrimonas citrea]NKZ37563.1 hypothetical protein [Oleiagrimonas citrea]
MKRMLLLGMAVTAALLSRAALADSFSANHFNQRVLPVLVHVNSQGKVTDVAPSFTLRPAMDRLLRSTLDEMIAKPAYYKGRAVASQFVINLGMEATPRADGRYDARFVYVSSKPVPSGQWFWRHVDGHRLVLVQQDAGSFGPRGREHFRSRPIYRRVGTPWVPTPARAQPTSSARTRTGTARIR